jgi:hypothetical protein
MREGCNERLNWEFVRWVWEYPWTSRPGVLQKLSELKRGQRVFHLRSTREVLRFLDALDRA